MCTLAHLLGELMLGGIVVRINDARRATLCRVHRYASRLTATPGILVEVLAGWAIRALHALLGQLMLGGLVALGGSSELVARHSHVCPLAVLRHLSEYTQVLMQMIAAAQQQHRDSASDE